MVQRTARSQYDEWVLDPDETVDLTLSDGDTFENALIDQRADGAVFTLKASGDDWTVRNVGFRGAGSWSDAVHYHMRLGCPEGGAGLVENVYVDNRQKAERMGMAWEQGSHAGHIMFRHTWIGYFGNNAAYFTNANKRDRAGGTNTHEYCYHINNTPTNYRIGGKGSVVRDSVSVCDDPPPQDRGFYLDGESNRCRLLGAWHTPDLRAENVSFYTNPEDVNPGAYFDIRHEDLSDGPDAELTAVDCRGNLSPQDDLFTYWWTRSDERLTVENYQQGGQTLEVLGEGVPLSPEMAARGERAIPDDARFDRH